MLAASLTYFPHPKSGGVVSANEYNQMKIMVILAPLCDKCAAENGQFIKQCLSYDKTVKVVIDVIPENILKSKRDSKN